MLERIARARAKARAHVWQLIEATPAGFPWLVIAGKALTGWVVIDMDATLVTASSDKEGAAPTWKKGYGFHPWGPGLRIRASAWPCSCAPATPGRTRSPSEEVLAAAIRQVPARFRRKIMVRVDGAGASHELVEHLLSMSSPAAERALHLRLDDHRGWRFAIRMARGRVEARHRPDGTRRGGQGRRGGHDLIGRAGNWPEGCGGRRRMKPSAAGRGT